MTEDTLYKILNNTATSAEKNEFFSQIEHDEEKAEEFYRHKNLFVISTLKSDTYHQKVQGKNFEKFWERIQSKKNFSLQIWVRYAAVFIIALALGVLVNTFLLRSKTKNSAQHIEYASETGSVSTIYLEDGSTIWLSSGSKLIMDKSGEGTTVARLDGEAYFDLEPNPERKFLVDFGQFKISDIGTKFNIRAYSSEKNISTSLIKGEIKLINNLGKSILSVRPGEFVKYDKATKKISVNECDTSIVTAWKDGKFVFIDQPLSEICRELENWYNIEIQIDDQKLADTRYTSVVKRSTTVQMVLKILAVTDQIHYKITEKKIGKDIIEISK